MASVTIDNLSKTFSAPRGNVQAVRDLSFEVKDGELLVLAGPSGCGKTTTLRLIAGLEAPTAGIISIDGKVMNDQAAKDRDVAMVFQNLALYPHMSARENIAFGLKARKHSKQEIASRSDEVIASLHLADCADRLPSEMSGGQRQRVALARALVLRPKVLLLDEPLSNLDGPLHTRMRLELSRLHRTLGMTMIYVTHDQIDAMSLAQRVAVMNEGKLRQIAEPMRIYREPADAFVAGFLGTPAMNFFHGQLGPESGALLFSEEAKASQMPSGGAANAFQVELPLEKAALRNCAGKAVLMGLRPEDITISIGNEPATIEAVIEKVEHLGPEVHVHARTAGHSFVLRQITSFAKELSEGAKALFEFNLKCAHFFDAASGARLG